MTPYDSSVDPLRTIEARVRAEIASINTAGSFPEPFHLVQQGKFSPGGRGEYAAIRCVTLQDGAPFEDRPFCVHDVVLMSEADGVRGVRLINGRYDLTVEEAAEAL